MMRNFPGFVLAVERRARLIRSGEAGVFILLVLGSAYFALSISLSLSGSAIPIALSVAGALIPLLAGGAVCLILYRRRIDPARLLLRLDLALGLEARLSSLQELGEDRSVAIRRRIEATIAPHLNRWRRGLPIPGRTIAGFILGISFLLAGLALTLFPVRSGPPPGGIAQAGVSAASPTAGKAVPSVEKNGVAGSPLEAAGETPSTKPQMEYSLADVIAELRIPPSLTEGTTASAGSEARLMELLTRIEDRLKSAGGLLTEAERAELKGAIPTAEPSVAEGLADLLAAASPAELTARLEELARAAESTAASETSGGSEGIVASPRPEGGSGDEGRSVGMPEVEAPTAIPASSPATPEGEGRFPGGGEGEEEAPAAGEASPPPGESEPPQLLTARVPGVIGEEGRLDLLLTAGVPIEDQGIGREGRPPAVSFAKIDSILSERSLPPAAVEAVRNYFETITEGGP